MQSPLRSSDLTMTKIALNKMLFEIYPTENSEC